MNHHTHHCPTLPAAFRLPDPAATGMANKLTNLMALEYFLISTSQTGEPSGLGKRQTTSITQPGGVPCPKLHSQRQWQSLMVSKFCGTLTIDPLWCSHFLVISWSSIGVESTFMCDLNAISNWVQLHILVDYRVRYVVEVDVVRLWSYLYEMPSVKPP